MIGHAWAGRFGTALQQPWRSVFSACQPSRLLLMSDSHTVFDWLKVPRVATMRPVYKPTHTQSVLQCWVENFGNVIGQNDKLHNWKCNSRVPISLLYQSNVTNYIWLHFIAFVHCFRKIICTIPDTEVAATSKLFRLRLQRQTTQQAASSSSNKLFPNNVTGYNYLYFVIQLHNNATFKWILPNTSTTHNDGDKSRRFSALFLNPDPKRWSGQSGWWRRQTSKPQPAFSGIWLVEGVNFLLW